jgi:neutral ceramidase
VGGAFGEVLHGPRRRYSNGETVVVQFVGGYPNNDLRRGSTFVEVQRRADDSWQRVADDGDWATKFHWMRAGRAGSRVRIEWTIPAGMPAGEYRLRYCGDVRGADGAVRPIDGATAAFAIR